MQQIDAAIDLLRLRQHHHQEWFRSERLCFIDTLLGTLWKRHYSEFLEALAKPDQQPTDIPMPPGAWDFHTGQLPLFMQSKKAWRVDIDEIYTAFHVNGNHWVAGLIDIPKRHITIWDSILGPRTEYVVGEAVKPVCEMLPYVLHVLADPDDRWQWPLEPFNFTVDRSPGLPQNEISGDCGVYCVKYIEFHSLGMPFPKFLCDENIKSIRDKLAHDVLKELGRTGVEQRTEYELLDMY